KGDQSRAGECFFYAFVGRTFDSATSQGVADNLHPHTVGASFLAQGGHLAYRHATGIGNHSRQSTLSSLLDFSDNRFFVFESYCHEFSPGYIGIAANRLLFPRLTQGDVSVIKLSANTESGFTVCVGYSDGPGPAA